jgi:hypothetical protein
VTSLTVLSDLRFFDPDQFEVEISGVLENQSTKADGWRYIAEESFDLGVFGEIPHDNR